MNRLACYNEIDPFCCDVLRARIAEGALPPGIVLERDIRTLDPAELTHHGQVHLFAGIGGGALACRLAGVPDDFRIITAGVPCQPASQAGKRLGADDDRWLWPEFFRLLRGLRSHYALVEQPPGIVSLNDGAEWRWILGTLAEIVPGYEVSRVSAAAMGAPHERERVWIVAYPDGAGWEWSRANSDEPDAGADGRHHATGRGEGVDDPAGRRLHSRGLAGALREADLSGERCGDAGDGCAPVGDASGAGLAGAEREDVRGAWRGRERGATPESGEAVEHALRGRVQRERIAGDVGEEAGRDAGEGLQREWGRHAAWGSGDGLRPWEDGTPAIGADGTIRLVPREAAEAGPESSLWPVADGLPGRVARLRAIGNAWVPQAAVPALRVILAHAAAEVAGGVA